VGAAHGGDSGGGYSDSALQEILGKMGSQQVSSSSAQAHSLPHQSAQHDAQQHPTTPQPHVEPRAVGSPWEESVRAVKDIGKGLTSALPDELQKLLGFQPHDTPEDRAKKKQLLDKYNQLSEEDRQFALKKFHEAQREKQQKEQEEQERKHKEAQAQQQATLPMPQGRRTGFMPGMIGQKNTKSTSTLDQMLFQQRQTKDSGAG
jgi:hypothetical protein